MEWNKEEVKKRDNEMQKAHREYDMHQRKVYVSTCLELIPTKICYYIVRLKTGRLSVYNSNLSSRYKVNIGTFLRSYRNSKKGQSIPKKILEELEQQAVAEAI